MKSFIKKITPRRYNRYILKLKIIKYLSEYLKFDKLETDGIVNFLKHNTLSIFPYNFTKKYKPEDVMVYNDNTCGTKYIIQDDKRLYFKKGWNEKRIKKYYSGLLLEQDIDSAHRYESEDFYVEEGDIVVDVGAAEGNFALSIVEKVKKLYLFEVDEKWIEALKITFAPWEEKVEIVCKYVSDNDGNGCISLDAFLNKQKIDFIKADIEGAEIALLKGSRNIISDNKNIKAVLTTYHKQSDAEEINNVLNGYGFKTEFSKGLMIFLHDKDLCEPYLRKGLIRGIKH